MRAHATAASVRLILPFLLHTGLAPVQGATPEPRVALDREARVSLQQDGSGWRLAYHVSASAGTVHILAADRTEGLHLPGAEFHREAIPASGSGAVPIQATDSARYYALTWDAEIGNPYPDRLVWVPPTHYVMGSPESETDRDSDESPRTVVTLPRGFYLGRDEVTQAEYLEVTGTNPSCQTGDPSLPVENVSWEEAREFTRLRTERDRAAGRIPDSYEYRLPTEAEWECAARAGTGTRFAFGDDPGYQVLPDHGWFADNSGGRSHPVGGKSANAWGFRDMAGNVGEWCLDGYRAYAGGRQIEPLGPVGGETPVIRGGSFEDDGPYLRSAFRYYEWTTNRTCSVGFRLALAPVARPAYEPGLELAWIPPGSFLMGSPESESGHESDEAPQTHITFTRGFWMGRMEVSQTQFEAWMGFNPATYSAPEQPVESLTWQEAADFCATLTAAERVRNLIPVDWAYRLPTEAEWEYAARAGTASRFSHGDDPGFADLDRYAWFVGSGQPHAIGGKAANPWGLHDMHGNVAEWCADDYSGYPGGSVVDPAPIAGNTGRNIRGGSFADEGEFLRSAFRFFETSTNRFRNVGFRVVLSPVRSAIPQTLPPPELVPIPAGRFLMGSPDTEGDRDTDEGPRTGVHGNVAEWCSDWYAPYAGGSLTDPAGPPAGFWRVLRGGSWDDAPRFCRSAARGADFPDVGYSNVGFRIVLARPVGTPR